MTDENKLQADESRILGIAAGPLLKMLRRRREIVLRRLYGNFRAGVKDFTADVAEFAATETLIHDIEANERHSNPRST